MPWYNFIDPVFLHRNKKKQSVHMLGVFEKYTFSNIEGAMVTVRINISENFTKSICIKLRKKNVYNNEDNEDNDVLNDLNRDSNDTWKTNDPKNYLNEKLRDKSVCIRNLVRDKDNLLIGDIYVNNTLINHLISPPCKKRVTFSNIDDSIVSFYTLIKSKVFDLFN